MNDLLKFKNKIGLPEEIIPLIERSITVEYASLTKRGEPLTYPVTPYVHPDGMSLSVSTGLTYPSKAERARNNPHVSLLFSDAVGTGIENAPIVQIFGHGVVRDSDLQANTDRYIQLSMAKLPTATSMIPKFIQKRMPFYYARVWVEIVPLRVLWWRDGDLQTPPQAWQLDPSIELPVSDPKPAPSNQKFDNYTEENLDWRSDLPMALADMGKPILTAVANDYPVPMRVLDAKLEGDKLILRLPHAIHFAENSPASLTFHEHDAVFSYQRNRAFKGTIQHEGDTCIFTVTKQLGDWSLKGSPFAVLWDFFAKGRKLSKRLEHEAQRRGQAVPEVRV